MKNNQCEIAIFFENHDDKGNSKAIISLLEPFKAKGYVNYLFEEPADNSQATTIKLIERAKHAYLDYVLGDNLKLKIAKKGYVGLNDKQLADLLADSANIEELVGIGRQYRDIKESYEATIELLNRINHDQYLNSYNIDMPSVMRYEHEEFYPSEDGVQTKENIAKRDEYMAEQAKEICQTGANKQVLLVGLSHYGIGDILENNGFVVNKIAVFANKPISIDMLPENLPQVQVDDLLFGARVRDLYSDQYKSVNNLVLIDLYQNPELDYASIILGALDQPKVDAEL
jgi:hypothetical protein